MANTHPPRCRGQSFSHATSSVINPLRPADEIEVLPVLIKVGPQSSPRMVPSRPRRRGHQIEDSRWGGCRTDQASEEGREGGRSRFGGQRTAARHLRLGRDRHTVNPRRHGQRFRTWETHASQRSLDLQTAGDPSLEGTRFHHCPKTARQLDSDDIGKVSGAEEHPLERRTQITQTPVREERVIEHTRQRIAFGNVLLCRVWVRCFSIAERRAAGSRALAEIRFGCFEGSACPPGRLA